MTGAVSAALQVYYAPFDAAFLKLPPQIECALNPGLMRWGSGSRPFPIASFPHYRLTGSSRHRLRASDYRIICTFDVAAGIIHRLAVGHQRQIYRDF